MGHASDCAVNDGPTFLPGPCDCGLELGVDAFELFSPLLVVGVRRGRFAIRQRNVEALIEAQEAPLADGLRLALTFDLKSAHCRSIGLSNANGVNVNDARVAVISKAEANTSLQGGDR